MRTLSCEQEVSPPSGRRLLAIGLFFTSLVACVAMGVSTAQAQTYSVKNMGMLPGMKSCEPTAINSVGQVIGIAKAGGNHCGFMYYYNGKEEEMEDIGGIGSRAFAVSPSGITVGDAYFPLREISHSHAALFNSGTPVDLGVLPGQIFSRATGINVVRHVVGYSGMERDGAQSRPFIWTSREGMIDIGTLGGPYAQVFAINDAGYVTGTSQINQWIRNAGTHAFIYQPLSETERLTEPMRDLGTLGGTSSYGMAINAANHVVGYSTVTFEPRVHAFFHNSEKMTDLGSLEEEGFDYSAALAINNADQVVGVSYVADSNKAAINQAAFLWRAPTASNVGGEMVNLNNLIATEARRYWLLSATAINDSGQIAASAYDHVDNVVLAVLLTPIK